MEPTVFGIVALALGAAVIWRPASNELALLMVSTLFGAAAAINLPALGGSSIQPAYVVLGLLTLRTALSTGRTRPALASAVSENLAFVLFVFYGAATAFILPKLFSHEINLPPMRSQSFSHIYFVAPLAFSSQNITHAVYLVGTLFAAVLASVVAITTKCRNLVVSIGIFMCWAHVVTGILAAAVSYAGHPEWVDIFRNASYAQLHQEVEGIVRITGIYPEPSAFCMFAFVWFVFMVELWLRNVRPRATGSAALATLAILLVSTSTTAYVSTGAYALILGLRLLLPASRLPGRKWMHLGLGGMIFIAVSLLLILVVPPFTELSSKIVSSMTVDKLSSASGVQRSFWVMQAFEAFKVSYGLGVGAGSFRSSSLLAAIAGSMGIPGLLTFAAHLWATLKPLKRSTYTLRLPFEPAVASAAAWTAVIGLFPLATNGASPDPGLLFGIFSGLAIGWRVQAAPAYQSALVRRAAAT